jgi:hypothetical protein
MTWLICEFNADRFVIANPAMTLDKSVRTVKVSASLVFIVKRMVGSEEEFWL